MRSFYDYSEKICENYKVKESYIFNLQTGWSIEKELRDASENCSSRGVKCFMWKNFVPIIIKA